MAEQPTNPPHIDTGSGAGQYQIVRTLPDELLRHDISDEELEMLCEGRRDNVWEGMWASIGALVGSIPSSISAVGSYWVSKKPLPLSDLLQMIIFVVAVVLTAVLYMVVRRRTKTVSDKQREIRDRTRRQKN